MRVGAGMCDDEDVSDNWHGDGFDSIGRRVFFGVCLEHTSDSEVDMTSKV